MTSIAPALARLRPPSAWAGVAGVTVASTVLAILVAALAARWPILAVALPAAGLAGVILLARPNGAVLLGIALIYTNVAVSAARLYGAPYLLASAVPLLFLVPIAELLLRRRFEIVVVRAHLWAGAFAIVNIASTLSARTPSDALPELVRLLFEGVLLFVVVTQVIRTPELLGRVIWVLLGVGAFLGGLSLFQQATGTFGNEYLGFAQVQREAGVLTAEGDLQPRVSGPIGEVNRYAQILLVLVPLGLIGFWTQPRPWQRWLSLGATALISAGVILTFSRGAALGFVLVLGAMVVLRYVSVRSAMALGVVALVVVAALSPTYLFRLATLEGFAEAFEGRTLEEAGDTALSLRVNSTLATFPMWADHPVLGVGPGQFVAHYQAYADQVDGLQGGRPYEPHSLLPGILAETGILGLATFLGFMGSMLVALERVRRRWRVEQPQLAGYAAGFVLAILAYLASGLFLHMAYPRYFWLLVGLAVAVIVIGERQARSATGDAGDPGAARDAGASERVR